MHDARVAAKKFFKQEVPIYGTISWLPVAHLDGDERARDVFEREAEKRAPPLWIDLKNFHDEPQLTS